MVKGEKNTQEDSGNGENDVIGNIGRMIYGNEDTYNGHFEKDKRSGAGEIHYSSGAHYLGFFRKDKKHTLLEN